MDFIKQNVGIDVDSQELKVNFQVLRSDLNIKIKGSRTFKNTFAGHKALEQWLCKKRVEDLELHMTMEATGVYYEDLAYYFEALPSYVVHVVVPDQSSAYLKSLPEKSKTDELDAKGLAQLGLLRNLRVWEPVSDQMRGLKKLVRERNRLVKSKTMVSNHLHAEKASHNSNPDICKRYEETLDFFDLHMTEIEKALKSSVAKDPELKERIDNVCTTKGLGFVSVISVVAEYNGFITFKNRNQVVSYGGYDVVKRESGTSIRGKSKISKKGNSHVRRVLYMAAMSAIQHDDHHKAYSNRIVTKTGVKMKGNVAIQRKLLLLIYTLFTKNETYDPKHHQKVAERLKSKKKKEASKKKIQVSV